MVIDTATVVGIESKPHYSTTKETIFKTVIWCQAQPDQFGSRGKSYSKHVLEPVQEVIDLVNEAREIVTCETSKELIHE